MASTSGKNAYVSFSGTDISGESNNWRLTVDQDLLDSTVFTDAAKTAVEGDYGWTVEVRSFFNRGTAQLEGLLNSAIAAGNKAMTLGPEGTTATYTKYSGTVKLRTYTLEAPVAGIVTLTATFQGDGALTRGTF